MYTNVCDIFHHFIATHETCDTSYSWRTYDQHCYKLLPNTYQSADDATLACQNELAHGAASLAHVAVMDCRSESAWISSTLLTPTTQIWLGCRNPASLFEQFCCDANADGFCEHNEATGYWPWGMCYCFLVKRKLDSWKYLGPG